VIADPVSLTIPLIGVRTALITLGRGADGTMQVPASTSVAGWYTGSALPGAIGPAIIVGHVDSVSGPGVFFRLPQLRRGDRVYVTRADGTAVVFRVTSVRTYAKDAIPAKAVYGATPDPELRLITCGGTFDDATGHYLSNVVVDAAEIGGPAKAPHRAAPPVAMPLITETPILTEIPHAQSVPIFRGKPSFRDHPRLDEANVTCGNLEVSGLQGGPAHRLLVRVTGAEPPDGRYRWQS
jgi:hypothetical protein